MATAIRVEVGVISHATSATLVDVLVGVPVLIGELGDTITTLSDMGLFERDPRYAQANRSGK